MRRCAAALRHENRERLENRAIRRESACSRDIPCFRDKQAEGATAETAPPQTAVLTILQQFGPAGPPGQRPSHQAGPMEHGLVEWVTRRGGIAHTSVARIAGFGPRTIALAVAAQEVERIRRSWVVTPNCAASRKRAASVGGRATCVSAAHTMGLWTPTSDDDHVWVPSSASRLDASGIRLHRAEPPIAVVRTDPLEPALNVLFHVARCLPSADGLAVWESALRKGVVEPATLAAIRWRSSRAREFARVATFLSDSGLETHFRELMLTIGVLLRQQVRIDGHPVDALIGDRLAVQIDGFAFHSSPADRRRDLRQDARLVLRGYTVLRFDYVQILFEPDYVIDTVRLAMAQGRQLAAAG